MLRKNTAALSSGKRVATEWSSVVPSLEGMATGKCFDSTTLSPSIIPTNYLQKSLFRLPIPKLEDTLKRYEAAVQPLVSPKQFEATKALINEFGSGKGKEINDELVRTDKANTHTSFISADWFDLYLRDRQALPINYNPSLVARYDANKRDGVTRAAYWIASSCRWYKMYRDNTLKPEVFYFGGPTHFSKQDWFSRSISWTPRSLAAKAMAIGSKFHAFPLDMSQYKNLFNSTRIPGVEVDTLKANGFTPYIIVNFGSNQYKVTVCDAAGNPFPEEQIYARLKAIVEKNEPAPKVDVGIFTSMKRNEWAAIRTSLERNPTNQASLQEIDNAMFVVNLDLDFTADFFTQEANVNTNRHFIVSNKNRWWDKSISVIITKDGATGVNFEHSWGDGVAVLRYTVDCFNDTSSRTVPANFAAAEKPTEGVNKLQWSLEPEHVAAAEKATKALQSEMNRMDYSVAMTKTLGRDHKLLKGEVKADPFMQMVMQLAWWRLNKSTVSTYESASTAAYLKGRTECIRSASMESQAFTLAFDDPKASEDEKRNLLVKAAKRHAKVTSEAKMGGGVDRHLFALKKTSERRFNTVPELFKDPSYATFGSNIISTSTLFSEALLGGGFGPVSPGYGIGYAVAPDMMQFNVSAWKGVGGPNHSAEDFAGALLEAVDDVSKLLKSK
eukprot:GILI01012145.1.p1 GENE.GILI01012145.1~~GILI01012145.1.p1  ORF type:complete len:687 (+),score=228.57 GILI01012145.1:52-2061(+)